MAALSHFDFVATAITEDGATENRCMFIGFATLTIADLIDHGVFLNNLNEDPLIPKDLLIAFWHPCYD
eukprot:7914680-Ditylum_brightwellii.AAC.1